MLPNIVAGLFAVVLSAGGAPAGVVVPKLNSDFDGAGVVLPAAAVLAAVAEPNSEVPDVAVAPPKRLPEAAGAVVFLFGVAVVASFFSSGLLPKVNPPTEPEAVLLPLPKSRPVVPLLELGAPPPKVKGVEVPDAGAEPKRGFWAPPVAAEEPNRPGFPEVFVLPNKLDCCVPAADPKGLLAAVVEGVCAEDEACPNMLLDVPEVALPKVKVGFDIMVGSSVSRNARLTDPS